MNSEDAARYESEARYPHDAAEEKECAAKWHGSRAARQLYGELVLKSQRWVRCRSVLRLKRQRTREWRQPANPVRRGCQGLRLICFEPAPSEGRQASCGRPLLCALDFQGSIPLRLSKVRSPASKTGCTGRTVTNQAILAASLLVVFALLRLRSRLSAAADGGRRPRYIGKARESAHSPRRTIAFSA